MADKALIIVESPTKARTISRFIGKNYVVRASNGHIRDLPSNASEIPPKYKKEKWSRLGINVADSFDALYVIPKAKKDHVRQLKEDLKGASLVYLATDEDREGESISWHLLQALKPKVPCKRLVFHEITKEAIQNALETPREIDTDLVSAQETRRIIDRLYGYEVSPLLWKKIAPDLSAGRVQSVAVRLLVNRERERIAFTRASYWTLKAAFRKQQERDAGGADAFDAELSHVDGKRVAVGKDFDANTGVLNDPGKVAALNADEAAALLEELRKETPKVGSVEEKPYVSKPLPPFVTSSLQQEANRKLRFSAKHTMTVAQQLYENGFITYMRTDSTTLSDQALNAARSLIKAEFGSEYLPDKPRTYVTKVKNAQEAHEAIRPAGENFTPIEAVRGKLSGDAVRLYELIWKRTIASQMTDARGTHIAVSVDCGRARFRAAGKTISFPGYLRAYVEGSDDPEAELADQEKLLPKLEENESVTADSLDTVEKTTQPPARFTEGSLIKELERLGIGRPSTWATVVDLVLNRAYAFKRGTALIPSFVGFAVVQLLERHFGSLVDYAFTAQLEDELDAISRGEGSREKYLESFYFGNGHPGLKSLVSDGEEKIDPRDVCGIRLGDAPNGGAIEVRIGRFGPFLTNGKQHAPLRDMIAPDEMTLEHAVELLAKAEKGPDELGLDPESGLQVFLKEGPYGPYVQLGPNEEGKKPKMASLLSNMNPDDVTLETALQLLSLPRTLGEHPESGTAVVAANGRYGPYIKCDKETRSIRLDEYSPLTITLEQALELLAQPKRRRAAAQPKVLRELGKHPDNEQEITLRSGRYGPYVTDGEINASLRRGMEPDEITLDEAVTLIEDRRAKGPAKKRRSRKK